MRAILDVQPAADSNVRGATVFDLSGVVQVATEPQLIGKNFSSLHYLVPLARRFMAIEPLFGFLLCSSWSLR